MHVVTFGYAQSGARGRTGFPNRLLDPTALPAVVATEGNSRRYTVVEGNRRVLALKALETPALVLSALSEPDRRQLTKLSEQFHQDPIESVYCVLFDSEEEARHWIKLRHTGQNAGIGLVEWNSDEKDRFDARHGGRARNLAGQALDFLRNLDGPSPDGAAKVPVTTLQRILKTASVRDHLGLGHAGGTLLAQYPQQEVAKGLRRIVEDLRSRTVKVSDVMTPEQQLTYVQSFSPDELPDAGARLEAAVPFAEAPETAPRSRSAKPKTTKPRPKSTTARVTLVPPSCRINPAPPRINDVFVELAQLDAHTFTNAASVLLRVFLELSVDHYIDQHKVMTEEEHRKAILAQKLKRAADHLHAAKRIPEDLRRVVHRVADGGRHAVAASVATFHLYVHNAYVFPTPSELQAQWDELQPFLEKVWA